MHKQSKNKIQEINSPAFERGFFHGTEALQKETYSCKSCLDAMKEHGYIINRAAGQEFVQGWKYSLE